MEKRVEALRRAMEEEGIGAYYVTNPYNCRYLSGFTGSEGWLVVTLTAAYLITDFRYQEQAGIESPDFTLMLYGRDKEYQTRIAVVDAIVKEHQVQHLGYEEEQMTVAEYDDLENATDALLMPESGMIELLRETKDESEIQLIKTACDIADKAFTHILEYIEPGMSEIQIANELDFTMRGMGASGVSFDTIVASGWRSAMPHGVASEKTVQKGELITLDYGCYYKGYVSDMTRTIALGVVDHQLEEIYQIVLKANTLVREQARPGLLGMDLEHIARDYIASAGYNKEFGHSLGHSIGLEIHEAPNANLRSHDQFQVNQLITDEPGIYIEGLGGVRIEDDLLFTPEGNEVLTHSTRELLVL
ncbi:MAG: aminopeptidase P family protein [Aerococcus sp.]|nr:aminopeptidase P family protein [Aerococcus sp.]